MSPTDDEAPPIRAIPGEPTPDAPGREAEEAAVNGAAEKPVGELFLEVTEQATVLVREELELAKAEISDKLNRLLAGSVVGVVAGTFLLAALILVMHGIAILLGDNVFDGRLWLGYFTEAVAFLLIAAGAGFYAYKSIRKGTPPVPEMAIEQAKEIRASLDPTEPPK
jgi:uncharacterized membrane protein YqjE